MYKHVLIATDGSELAARGLEHGLTLAGALGAEVSVLTVTKALDSRTIAAATAAGVRDPVTRYDQSIDAEMKARFAEIGKRADEKGLSVNLIHEIDDSPAEAILRTAKMRGCDLIVMASHGRRGARKLILGSQTSEVLAHTTTAVLVVR